MIFKLNFLLLNSYKCFLKLFFALIWLTIVGKKKKNVLYGTAYLSMILLQLKYASDVF